MHLGSLKIYIPCIFRALPLAFSAPWGYLNSDQHAPTLRVWRWYTSSILLGTGFLFLTDASACSSSCPHFSLPVQSPFHFLTSVVDFPFVN